jgi:hypothetical protein
MRRLHVEGLREVEKDLCLSFSENLATMNFGPDTKWVVPSRFSDEEEQNLLDEYYFALYTLRFLEKHQPSDQQTAPKAAFQLNTFAN